MGKVKICTKKKFTNESAKYHLKKLLEKTDKHPWRDEISTYLCDICNFYHLTSTPNTYVPLMLKDKNYFEIQKEKWGNFLQKYSKNKGRINKRNKKYGT